MKFLPMRLDPVFHQRQDLPFPFNLVAASLTPLFRAGMQRRLRGPRTRVDAHVISFGNLTTGGTGKTPAVIARARQEAAAGRRVAVITRGYGSRKVTEPFVVLPNAPVSDTPLYTLIGDEPALIRMKVPEITVVKSADRVAGARAAIASGCDTILLDDGFQAVALERDENLLLVDASNPFGNGHLLPRGPMREPLEAAARATAIILTRCDQAETVGETEALLRSVCPDVPITRTRHAPTGLWNVVTGERVPVAWLRDRQVYPVCAIGNPDAFVRTLINAGALAGLLTYYGDHKEIAPEVLLRSDPVIVTEKDAVRLGDTPGNVWALEIQLEPMP